MSERKLLTSKRRMKFELELVEIGCIREFLSEQSINVKRWGNATSGMEDWQAEILHRLAAEFQEAEAELDTFVHGAE